MIEREHPKYDDLVIWSDLDEIPWPTAMEWVIKHPPGYYYRFLGFMFFYNYRWRSPEPWQWAYIMKYGAKRSHRNWFQYRNPNEPPFEYVFGFPGWEVGSQSLYHCSYCFPAMRQIIEKLKSFSHGEFALGQYVDPNYIYTYVYCGHSLFQGNYTSVDFQSMGIDIPDTDERFNYLKMKLSFNDLDQYQFNITRMREYAPCEIDFLKGRTELPNPLPNHIK
jgi:hypothetical protein